MEVAEFPVLSLGRGGIPVRYKKATVPLDETARARLWGSSSGGGGSEFSSSPENSPELSDLVDAFYDQDEVGEESGSRGKAGAGSWGWSMGNGVGNGDYEQALKAVLAESVADSVAEHIRSEVVAAVRVIGSGEAGFKRRVVSQLRDKGFDAGLCRSQWDQSSRLPAGYYEYIDVIADDGARYIVEIDPNREFEVARPTAKYLALLDLLPEVFVGRPDMLKGLLKSMSAAAKDSMKSVGMHMPPWRRWEYTQAKWFNSDKRSTDRIPVAVCGGVAPSSRTAFAAAGTMQSGGLTGQQFCRIEFTLRERPKLAMAFKGM